MIRYAVRALWAHARAARSLVLLSVFGVALGVASVLSIQIINRNALGAFEGSVRAVSGDADFSIVGVGPDLPETSYPEVLGERDVEVVWPIYRVDVAVTGREDYFLEVLGFDMFSPLSLPWESVPESAASPVDTPGWVAISPELGVDLGLALGGRFEVSSGSRRVTLTVGALVDFRKITPLAPSRMVVMDIAQAQGLLGRRGRIHQLDVKAREGADLGALRARIAARLGPGSRILTPEQRRNEASALLGAFRLNLTALSLVSLFVGAFLIYSSVQAALLRRRGEFGLLRSLGATRGQLLFSILGEVALLGLLGVLLGLPLGYAAAVLNVDRVSQTLTNLYMLEAIETLELPAGLYLLAVAIGVGAALLGALGPAIDVSRRDTRSLLASVALHERIHRLSGPLAIAGVLAASASWVFWYAFVRSWRPAGFLVGVGLLVGLPLATPWLVAVATRRLRAGTFGLLYGVKALGLKLQSGAVAVAALAVVVSMLLGITLMIGSFRRTVDIWLESSVRADIYVTSESWRRAREDAVLEPELVRRISELPGVRATDRLRHFFVLSGGRKIGLGGADLSSDVDYGRFTMLEGRLDEALRRAREESAALISEPLARKNGLGIGDALRVAGPSGELRFPVAGIFYDYSNEGGSAYIDLRTMERAFGPGEIGNVALYVDPGVDPEALVDTIKARFPDAALQVRSNRALREEIFAIFDQTFAVTRLLQAMSLLIAACSIALTLIVMARERVAELALYRALGARRRQIFRVFLGQGLGIAGFGLLLGVVGGIALALVLILIINRAYFGWTIALHWPWAELGWQIATILAVSFLASVYPALRASGTPASELSHEDA